MDATAAPRSHSAQQAKLTKHKTKGEKGMESRKQQTHKGRIGNQIEAGLELVRSRTTLTGRKNRLCLNNSVKS